MTCASGTLDTTSRWIAGMSGSLDTSPCRAYNSGAMAMCPSLAKRRHTSLMCSWTPKISCTTSTTGKEPLPAGMAR